MSDICLYQTKKISLHKDIFMREHINEFENAVKSHIADGATALNIDFSEIENIDIIGFGVLTKVQKISITNNVDIRLFNVQDNVKKILKTSCLILDIYDGEEEENSIHEEIALIA